MRSGVLKNLTDDGLVQDNNNDCLSLEDRRDLISYRLPRPYQHNCQGVVLLCHILQEPSLLRGLEYHIWLHSVLSEV